MVGLCQLCLEDLYLLYLEDLYRRVVDEEGLNLVVDEEGVGLVVEEEGVGLVVDLVVVMKGSFLQSVAILPLAGTTIIRNEQNCLPNYKRLDFLRK